MEPLRWSWNISHCGNKYSDGGKGLTPNIPIWSSSLPPQFACVIQDLQDCALYKGYVIIRAIIYPVNVS